MQASTQPEKTANSQPKDHPSTQLSSNISMRYDPQVGTIFETDDNNFKLISAFRFQSRLYYPWDNTPSRSHNIEPFPDIPSNQPFNDDSEFSFDMTRVRWHLDGHAYTPDLGYSINYDLKNGELLTGRLNYRIFDHLQFRFGRWNPEYGRERNASTRDMQVADRSIINPYFMLDRQQGVMLHGRAYRLTLTDLNYYLGIFNGTGRTESNDDDHFMYTLRVQANILGNRMFWRQGDLFIHDVPHFMLAIGGATNISKCTAYATSGCRALPGFTIGDDGQYKLEQWFFEAVWKYQGISLQSEYHRKDVIDRRNSIRTKLDGYYIQGGFFPGVFIDGFASNIEIAGRFATVTPDIALDNKEDREYSFAVNMFFNGHRNRLSLDVSDIRLEFEGIEESDTRYRLQWELNF